MATPGKGTYFRAALSISTYGSTLENVLFGIKLKNWKEAVGQIPRLLFGGVKSFVGRIPVGNTGGANVPPLQPMEVPEDLAAIINNTKTK